MTNLIEHNLLNSSDMKENCPICYESCSSYVNLSCNHQLCLSCFIKNINHINIKCPLCRSLINESKPIIDSFNDYLNQNHDLLIKSVDLKNKNDELLQEINELNEVIIQKDEKIDKYNDLLIDANKNSINLLNRLIELL